MIKRETYLTFVFGISLALNVSYFLLTTSPTSFGGIIPLGILFFVFIPFTTFFYTSILLDKDDDKAKQSLLCPGILAISSLVSCLINISGVQFALIVLAWGLIWSLVGLIRPKQKKVEITQSKSVMKKKTPKLFWLWMPIVNCVLLMIGYLILLIIPNVPKLVVDIFIWFYAIIMAPLMSIFYCKRICVMGLKKYLCCVFNAIMMGMYIVISKLLFNLDFLKFSVLSGPLFSVLFSGLICGIITLMIYDVRMYHIKNNDYAT